MFPKYPIKISSERQIASFIFSCLSCFSWTVFCLSVLRQRVAQQLGGNVHDGNDPLVIHAFRADYGERADYLPIGGIGRGDHAAFSQRSEAGFAADKNVDALPSC